MQSVCSGLLLNGCDGFSEEDNGAARLVEGSADAGGGWEYGRLEIIIDGVWTTVGEGTIPEDLGRRGAQVACRSLGYATGAQLLVGDSSPFPAPPGVPRLTSGIECIGSESNLGECEISFPDYYRFDYYGDVRPNAVALLCNNPSGAPV